MIVIKNQLIPLPGYKAMTLWPFIFVRAKYMTERDMRHEEIHGAQQLELLVVGAALAVVMAIMGCGWWSLLALPLYAYVYFALWVWAGFKYDDAYKNNPMEREAYFFEGDDWYLEHRRPFAWTEFFSNV